MGLSENTFLLRSYRKWCPWSIVIKTLFEGNTKHSLPSPHTPSTELPSLLISHSSSFGCLYCKGKIWFSRTLTQGSQRSYFRKWEASLIVTVSGVGQLWGTLKWILREVVSWETGNERAQETWNVCLWAHTLANLWPQRFSCCQAGESKAGRKGSPNYWLTEVSRVKQNYLKAPQVGSDCTPSSSASINDSHFLAAGVVAELTSKRLSQRF